MPKTKPPPLNPLATRAGIVAPSTPGQPLAGSRLLPLRLVDPNPTQSRQVFDEQALAELADSIREHGVLEPILVRPVGERFQVVAGERRTRAALLADLADIPVIIREMTDEEAAYVTAVENLQREDLDLEDEGRQYVALLELTGLSQRELARRLGLNHEYLSRRIRLLSRPDLIAHVRSGAMTQRAAIAALAEAERLTAQVNRQVSTGETLPPEDSNEAEDDPPLVERYELDARPADRAPAPPAYRFRPFQQASDALMKAASKLTAPLKIPPEERPLLAQQLGELEAQISRLGLQVQELRTRLEEE